MQKWLVALGALVLMGSLAGLPSMAQAQGASSASGFRDHDFQRAVELYHADRLDDALTGLRGFVIRNPNSPLLPQAYLYMARIFHDQGRCGEALLYLDRLPPGEATAEERLIRASCLVQQGEAAAGVDILLPLQDVTLDPPDRALAFGRLGDGYAALDQPLRALLFYRQALTLGVAAQRWQEKAQELLRGRIPETVLDEAAFMFQGSAMGQEARLQLALRALDRGDRERAANLAADILNDPTLFEGREQASRLLSQLRGDAAVEADSLGVLLPLSGRFASFGELVRRGVELALRLHNQSGRPPVRFVYRDSGGEAAISADAVTGLVSFERVAALIGPLTGAAAQSAAQRAEREGVPLLTLSPRDGLPQSGSWIFRNSLTNRQQARAIAAYAVEQQGMRRFGILHPRNRLGEDMRDLFINEVARRGGQVVRIQGYDERATDFRSQVRLLMGLDPNAPDERRTAAGGSRDRVAEEKAPPPFDALFIPDYADRVGVIAPQLVYYGLEDMPLLGINGWNSPDLLRLAGRFVEGAVFVDGFFSASTHPMVQEFSALYRDTYGEEPTILEAQAFDSAGVLLFLLSRPDVRSREDLRRALLGLRDYPGVTGNLSVDVSGEFERSLFVIQVKDGRFVQVQ